MRKVSGHRILGCETSLLWSTSSGQGCVGFRLKQPTDDSICFHCRRGNILINTVSVVGGMPPAVILCFVGVGSAGSILSQQNTITASSYSWLSACRHVTVPDQSPAYHRHLQGNCTSISSDFSCQSTCVCLIVDYSSSRSATRVTTTKPLNDFALYMSFLEWVISFWIILDFLLTKANTSGKLSCYDYT